MTIHTTLIAKDRSKFLGTHGDASNSDSSPPSDSGPESVYLSSGKYGPYQVMVRSASATFIVDEPFGAGGLGAGPTPFDLLSAALGSCALMTMRLYATEHDWPLERVVVRVTHDREKLTSRDHFLKEIQIDGALSPEQKEALLEVSMRCPTHLTVARGSDIDTRMLLEHGLEESAIGRTSHMRRMKEAVAKD